MSTAVQPKAHSPPHVKIEKQYKLTLIRRWFDFIWRTAVFSGLVMAVSTFFITCKPSTLIYGFLAGLFGFPFFFYPVLAIKRNRIISPSSGKAKSSPISLFLSTTTSSRSIRYLFTHITFAVGFTLLYTQIISWSSPQVDFGLFRPTARHPLHLNERVAFLLWGNVAFFLIFIWLSDTLSSQYIGSWPTRRTPLFVAAQKGLDEGLGQLLELLPTFSWGYTLFAPLFSVLYWYFRRRIWYLAAQWGLSSFLINWARSSKTNLSVDLVGYLYALILASLVLFRLPTAIMNAYVMQPLSFTSIKSPLTPDRYLLEALKSQNPYNNNFTLMELLRVAYDPARRAKIFNEPSTSPSARSVLVLDIWQELLLHFGRCYKVLSTRGGTLSVPQARAPVQPAGPDPRAIQVKQGDVFRPVNKPKSAITSVLQNVLDGPVKPTPPAVLNAERKVVEAESKALKQVEDVAREAVKRLEGYEQGRAVVQETKGLLEGVFSWVGKEWARRSVRTSVPEPMVIRWLVDIFATLAVASAGEDQYGYVQTVLPATLEGIVRYRSALLSLESELLSKARTIGRPGEPAAAEVKRLISQSVDACDQAVLRIGERFGKSLSAFRFTPGVASQLSEICRPLETVEEG